MNGDSGPSRRCRAFASSPADEKDEDIAIGRCPQMIEAFKTAGSAAPTDATVLIRGESGTGKDLMARAIHRASARPGRFVAVNCAAVVESLAESELFGHERGAFTGATDRRAGCLESADGGTLFLDEIGEATPSFQAKLLRALDRGEFYRVGGRSPVRSDVRVVAATNRDLESAVEAGTFRADLFYRLTEVSIHLPAVRERQEDIPQLVGRLLSRIARRLNRRIAGASEEALVRLVSHRWPGNVREMQNVLTRAVLVCRGDTIQARHLGGLESGPATCPGVPTLEAVERDHIRRVLEAAAWNRGRSCEILGITRPTLRRKMRAYRITCPFDDEIDVEGPEEGLRLDSPGGSGHDSPAPQAGLVQALTG
jgi:two-component system response regulator AtoC